MDDRDEAAQAFLLAAGWQGAAQEFMTGDASARSYLRLRDHRGASAVFMNAPGDQRQSVPPFLRIAHFLRDNGFSAPEILAADTAMGFVLLEDLGDSGYSRLMEADPTCQRELYSAAIDMLADLSKVAPPPQTNRFTPQGMASMIQPVFDYYVAGAGHVLCQDIQETLTSRLEQCLRHLDSSIAVLALRDCHADNLIWLSDRTGVARVGILDFQDALLTHPAYDLVSLLQDARRDISADLTSDLIDRYLARTGMEPVLFRAAYAALGLQRNLRILGIFARLALMDGKTRYLALLPRVWRHIEGNLQHASLADLTAIVRDHIPAPTEPLLRRIAGHAVA